MKDKKTYQISVIGCDDSTIFEMILSKREAELVMRLAERCSKNSIDKCMPKMEVVKVG
jgi:hypothetical protein